AYPVMLRQGFGHIVNTASMQGLLPGPLLASYATTKAAVVSLSRSLRAEAASAGIRVSVLCPGVIRTPILHGGAFRILRFTLPDGGMADRGAAGTAIATLFERLRPMDATRFAHAVLTRVARNRAIIIVPAWWRVLWWLDRIAPWSSDLVTRAMLPALR